MKQLILGIALGLLIGNLVKHYSANAQASNEKFENTNNGKSHVERIDSNVAQINTMMGQIAQLRADVDALKAKVDKLE